AVHALLQDPEVAALVPTYGRTAVTDAIREALQHVRNDIKQGRTASDVGAAAVLAQLRRRETRSLRRIINATGVVLHTNLGRAPLAETARRAVLDAAGYCSVEIDVATGLRGDRHSHTDALLAEQLGCDGALVFNNCAGAVFLMLAALCRGRQVIVARGELVEIGGGFRIPDVMTESGAQLVEVGTTNKVYDRDYRSAVTEHTGAILSVHRSNFALLGFTHEPTYGELAEVARAAGVPLLVDIGSGLLADAEDLGPAWPQLATEPRPADALAQGANLVAFSADKLLGGPQAGILAGDKSLLDACRRHPLARALRADKLTLAALEATLRLYRDGRAREIPGLAAMRKSALELDASARKLAEALRTARPDLPIDLIDGVSVPGGGALPLAELPTRLVLVGAPGSPARALAQALRTQSQPIMTRFVDDRVAFDVRTLSATDLDEVITLVRFALRKPDNDHREEPTP
ncbi:MAG: L-seryl-tRNA(Sec) selenium transferase, partial [Myxococcota bacterium]